MAAPKNPYTEALAKESKDPRREKVVLGISSQSILSRLTACLLKDKYEVLGLHIVLGPLTLKVMGWDLLSIEHENLLKKWCSENEVEYFSVDFKKESDAFMEAYLLKNLGMAWKPNLSALFHSQFLIPKLSEWAQSKNIVHVASGHRARISQEKDIGLSLWKAKDDSIDQSYLLSLLNKSLLAKCIFPLGHFKAQDLEKLLKQHQIVSEENNKKNHCEEDKKRGTWPSVLEILNTKSLSRVKAKGYVLDEKQRVYGEHKGLLHSEVGSSDGIHQMGVPANFCVLTMDLIKQWVVVGPPERLLKSGCLTTSVHWVTDLPQLLFDSEFEILIHHSKKSLLVKTKLLLDSMLQVTLKEGASPFEARTGDYVSLYRGNHCLGSAQMVELFL